MRLSTKPGLDRAVDSRRQTPLGQAAGQCPGRRGLGCSAGPPALPPPCLSCPFLLTWPPARPGTLERTPSARGEGPRALSVKRVHTETHGPWAGRARRNARCVSRLLYLVFSQTVPSWGGAGLKGLGAPRQPGAGACDPGRCRCPAPPCSGAERPCPHLCCTRPSPGDVQARTRPVRPSRLGHDLQWTKLEASMAAQLREPRDKEQLMWVFFFLIGIKRIRSVFFFFFFFNKTNAFLPWPSPFLCPAWGERGRGRDRVRLQPRPQQGHAAACRCRAAFPGVPRHRDWGGLVFSSGCLFVPRPLVKDELRPPWAAGRAGALDGAVEEGFCTVFLWL